MFACWQAALAILKTSVACSAQWTAKSSLSQVGGETSHTGSLLISVGKIKEGSCGTQAHAAMSLQVPTLLEGGQCCRLTAVGASIHAAIKLKGPTLPIRRRC